VDTTELIALSKPEAPATRTDVLRGEREAVTERRGHVYGDGDHSDRPLTGLALSGGGIRSATFCLGVLEEFEQRNVRGVFDYLSTVSGGGYIGSWWSAYLSRKKRVAGHDLISAVRDAVSGIVEDSPMLKACAPNLVNKARQTREEQVTDAASFPAGFPQSRLSGGSDDEDFTLRHLRLHSNYLTPRKGLSWDTWRAVTVITRNLILTWAVLLPFTLAAVVVAQIYFLLVSTTLFTTPPATVAEALAAWWVAAGPPILGILNTLGILTLAWLLYQGPRSRVPQVGVCAAAILIAAAAMAVSTGAPNAQIRWFTLGVALLATALYLSRFVNSLRHSLPTHSDHAVRRNQIVYVQERMVALLVTVTAGLVTGGLAHLLFPLAEKQVGTAVAEAGGWMAVLAAIGSAVYTVLQASPAGGADHLDTSRSRLQRVLFAVAPVLLLIVLLVLMAQFTRDVLVAAQENQKLFHALLVAALMGVLLCWVYASYETSWHKLHRASRHRQRLVVAGVGIMAGLFASTVWRHAASTWMFWIVLAFAVWCFDVIARRLGASARSDEERQRSNVVESDVLHIRLLGLGSAVATFFAALVLAGSWWLDVPLIQELSVLALVFSCALIALTWQVGSGQTDKAQYLLAYAAAVSTVLLAMAYGGWIPPTPAPQTPSTVPLWAIAVAMLTSAGAWTLAFGWSTDPNNLSMHAFYRARLVRAYLGASNLDRRNSQALIDDAVTGDDVRLHELQNTSRGAPYHLVNATLNLSGDSELGSVQRRATPFIFSPKFCGGAKCGYRATATYMGGQMTLGTAVAVSGAAASPNMGSQTPSAPLAMLMTFFNVRLGFWAPTPCQKAWRSRQARFWSFYTLTEFLSRTTDRASYCFLSDGGHFDNTGVYALVERGCRIVVLVDCGADGSRTFTDLGNLARRVRIDFGAEIDIDLADLGPTDPKSCRNPFVVGTILYSPAYLREIGDPNPDDPSAYLVVIKPSVIGYEPADVRQYGFQNQPFPQQSTIDQFFDEAQFESYRRLGMHCAECALDALLPASAKSPTQLLDGLLGNLQASVMRGDTPISAADSASHRIFQQLQRRALQVIKARDVVFEPSTESLVWNYLRRSSAAMLHSGRRRADDVADAQLVVSQLVSMMAEGARKRDGRTVDEEDFIEARSRLLGSFPFTLLHGGTAT
jgi:hypothetical protein